jgi:hypothetical protein
MLSQKVYFQDTGMRIKIDSVSTQINNDKEYCKFILEDNFLGLLEENQFVYDHLIEEQEKEEKEHQTRWKKTKNEYMKLKENMSLIRHKIDMITT